MGNSDHSNSQIQKEIFQRVTRELQSDYGVLTNVVCGPLEINCFSVCFWLTFVGKMGLKGVYVKIPKIILYNKENEKIIPFSYEEKKLAEQEYDSLVHLSQHWKSEDIRVQFVKQLGFIEKYNAIVTERFYAKHFFQVFRQRDLKRRIGKDPDVVHDVMSRLGMALSRFHQTSVRECTFNSKNVILKMRNICSELKSFGIEENLIDSILHRLSDFNTLERRTYDVCTLKGFDVRQVFVDEDGAVFLLDPGKMKTDYREMDLARFIATCRILYWGSIFFLFRLSPHYSYEKSFIDAYYGDNKRDDSILFLLTVKELLKHWRMAYSVLGFKQWPVPVKLFIRKIYIDPFYKVQIFGELDKLEK